WCTIVFLLSIIRSSFLVFFFSSRRRHTRSYGDWSSDVCSSDLPGVPAQRAVGGEHQVVSGEVIAVVLQAGMIEHAQLRSEACRRSEERRVGKGGRWGGAREDEKEKRRCVWEWVRRAW